MQLVASVGLGRNGTYKPCHFCLFDGGVPSEARAQLAPCQHPGSRFAAC